MTDMNVQKATEKSLIFFRGGGGKNMTFKNLFQ